ncbi:MAG: hypothetical protein DRJ67_07760 [Thermoprotei archaeon]|nr:MAG: hypothetical protein DRJ67_07760 [Thermoprotei archaeon]
MEVLVVMERGCPGCNALIRSRFFYSLMRRVASAGPSMASRIINLAYDEDIQEATALWAGLTPRERQIYVQGGIRGSPKTPTIVIWDGEGKWPHVMAAPQITEDEVENYKEVSRMASLALGHALSTRIGQRRESEGRRRRRRGGEEG